ncbi:MAG TPA: histidine kinase [Gemmatimonadaceae bacterium]
MADRPARRGEARLLWGVATGAAALSLLTFIASRFVPELPIPRGALPRMKSAPSSPTELLRSLGVGSLIWYGCFASAPFFVWLSRRVTIDRRTWKTGVSVHLAAVILFALATAWLQFHFTYHGSPMAPPLSAYLKVGLITDALPYLTVAVAAHAIDARTRVYERDLEAARVRSQLAESRLEALTAQLQPHFLFNTLQGISTLITRNPVAADAMLSDLSDLLREVLRRGERREVTVDEELRVLESYLSISRRRVGERLAITVSRGDDVGQALVPFFVLQPLVENALHHGVGSHAGPATVSVDARRDDQRLVLTVTDNGPAVNVPDSGRGIGLANTRERLSGLYGDAQRLDTGRSPDGGFTVRVELPFHEADDDGKGR